MSNLGQSQAAWTKFFGDTFGLFGRPIKRARELKAAFDLETQRAGQVEVENEPAATPITAWALAGFRIGTHGIGESDVAVVRVLDEDPAPNQARVTVYRTTGGAAGDRLCEGTAANGAVVTLTELNSSGVTGTCTLGTITGSSTDDRFRLRVRPDNPVQARHRLDGTEAEHDAQLKRYLEACQRSAALAAQIEGEWATALRDVLTSEGSRGRKFLRSSASALISFATKDTNGTITSTPTGVLRDLNDAMRDELTGGAQTIDDRPVTVGTVAEDASNQGQLEQSVAATMEEWAQDGRIDMICVAGADTDTIPEKFELSQLSDEDGKRRAARNRLTVRAAFADPNLGIRALMLERQVTIVRDSANQQNSFAAQVGSRTIWNATGETASNTDAGALYVRLVTNGAGAWNLTAYTDSGFATGTEVLTATAVATGAIFTWVEANGSGLAGIGQVGAAPVTGTSTTVNLNCARVQRVADGLPDKLTLEVTQVNTAAGDIQDIVAEEFGYAIRSGAAPTIDNDLITAGTFKPYSVRDV